MFIFAIIGYTLLRIFSGDVAHWLRWENAEWIHSDWVAMLANDLKGEGLVSTLVWMAPFILVAALGTVRSGFSGLNASGEL
ncbi:hypothetical protein [Psychromonas sp. SP041]|uniref:hypothetical protein n=1 Tax=Psychromonas sp. SP041 TaxID=1365007 RepID=UPI0010C79915|nr:hypothetical protein [Psychromonas sp. SP041]